MRMPLDCPIGFFRITLVWYLMSSTRMVLAPDPVDNSGYIGRFEAATGAQIPSHRGKRADRYEDPVFFPSDGSTTTAIHLQEPEWTPVSMQNRQEQVQTLSHGSTRLSSPPGEASGRPKRARDEPQEIGPPVVGEQDKLSRPFGSFSEQAFKKIMKAHNSQSFPYLKLADISPASVQLDSSIRLGQPIMGDYSQGINAYTGRYEVLIEDILETAHKLPNAYVGRKTRGWPATVVRPRHSEIEGEIILVLPTKDGDWRDAKSLVTQFKSLHRWIVYVHHLLLKNNNNNPTSSSLASYSYHQEMLLWLFGEVFNPKVGLPVIGRLDSASSNRQVFGPPQRWIMEFLVDNKPACTVSLALLGIWYLNAKSEEWRKEFRTDEIFWSRMTTAINNDAKAGTEATGIHLRLKKRKKYEVRRNSKSMQVEPQPRKTIAQIDNFRLLTPVQPEIKDTQVGLGWLTNKKSRISPEHQDSEFTKQILDEMSHVARLEKDLVCNSFSEIGIALVASVDPEYYHIRMMGSKGLCKSPKIRDKTRNLLNYLEKFSTSAFLELNTRGVEDSALLNSHFLAWLSEKLMGKKVPIFGAKVNTSLPLPVIGLVRKSIIQDHGLPPFDEVQLFIISSLSSTSIRYQLQESALTILGYWLKNYCQEVWSNSFGTDEMFSEFLKETM